MITFNKKSWHYRMAKLGAEHGGVDSSLDEDWEKFAELIALECSSLCYNSNLKDSDAHAMNILNHFNIDGARHWK